MRHKLPVFTVAVALSAIAWALHAENPIISLVVVTCAAMIALAAIFEKPEPDSANALRRKMIRYAKLARTTSPDEFADKYQHDLNGAAMLASDKYGIHARYDMQNWLGNRPRTEQDMKNIVTCLEEMIGRLK